MRPHPPCQACSQFCKSALPPPSMLVCFSSAVMLSSAREPALRLDTLINLGIRIKGNHFQSHEHATHLPPIQDSSGVCTLEKRYVHMLVAERGSISLAPWPSCMDCFRWRFLESQCCLYTMRTHTYMCLRFHSLLVSGPQRPQVPGVHKQDQQPTARSLKTPSMVESLLKVTLEVANAYN